VMRARSPQLRRRKPAALWANPKEGLALAIENANLGQCGEDGIGVGGASIASLMMIDRLVARTQCSKLVINPKVHGPSTRQE